MIRQVVPQSAVDAGVLLRAVGVVVSVLLAFVAVLVVVALVLS